MRDYQVSKLYNWEQTLPSGGMIEIENAQAIVNHVWTQEKLDYPPTVVLIDQRTTKWAGKASRMRIQLQPTVCMRVLLHEMSHSMTSSVDCMEGSMQHNEWFVGVYIKLLEKYLNVPMPLMLYTLNKHNVDFDIMAYPTFLDD